MRLAKVPLLALAALLVALPIVSCAHFRAGRTAAPVADTLPVNPSTPAETPAPARAPGLRLELNVPAFRLDVFRDTQHLRSYTVAVGLPDDQTPRGAFAITEVEWNPWWIPPNSDWAKGEEPEPPGPLNRVGRVKMRFLPLYLVHGTPFVETLGAARSRGCVRLANRDAVELALMVHESGSPELGAERLVAIAADTATVRIQLTRAVPITVRYELMELRGDSAVFYPDIYEVGWSRARDSIFTRLARAGVDTAGVNERAFEALTNGKKVSPTGVALKALRR